MKKQKLNLKDLKVKSFVTGFDNDIAQTAKGGSIISGTACGSMGISGCEQCLRSLGECPIDFK